MLELLNEMRNHPLVLLEKEIYFRQKYPEFVEKYPRLFLCAIDPSFPLFSSDAFLGKMLDMSKTLLMGEVGEEDADKIIYDDLREKYVTPVIEKLMRGSES